MVLVYAVRAGIPVIVISTISSRDIIEGRASNSILSRRKQNRTTAEHREYTAALRGEGIAPCPRALNSPSFDLVSFEWLRGATQVMKALQARDEMDKSSYQ